MSDDGFPTIEFPTRPHLQLGMTRWSDPDWQALQFGPLWVASAVVGRSWFDELERRAFATSLLDAPQGNLALPWQLMQAVARNQDDLFDHFVHDNRSIASGLTQVVALLTQVDIETSRLTREAILRVGVGLARARGPFGRQVTEQDAQQLLLVALLLETPFETTEGQPLNAAWV